MVRARKWFACITRPSIIKSDSMENIRRRSVSFFLFFCLGEKRRGKEKGEGKESRILVEIRPRRETAKAFAGQEGLLITVRDG